MREPLQVVLTVAVALGLPLAAAADHSETELVSTGPDGGNGPSAALFRSASSDGSKVWFTTTESLSSADTDGRSDLYQRRGMTTTTWLSTGPDGGNGDFDVFFQGASKDGSKVFFDTADSLVLDDTDGRRDIYLRSGATTTRLSTGPDGGNGPFDCAFRRASQDGSRVFLDTAEALVSADTDSQRDIYERSGTTTTLLSTGPDGGNSFFDAFFDGTSQDGSKVFFSTAEPLVSDDLDGRFDVYERSGTTTTLISTGPDGGNGDFHAFFWSSSQDGSKVVIATSEPLVAADTDSQSDLYERSGTTTTLLSTGPAGGNGAFEPGFERVSADGSRVFFTTAESLVFDDTDSQGDVYMRSGTTITRLSTGPAGGNGAFEALFGRASQDGSKVYFTTAESLLSADTDSQVDVYERSGTTTTLVSTGPAGGNGPFAAGIAGLSQDGSRVFFQTIEPIVAADTDASLDIYERSGAATTLLSTGPDGGNGALYAFFDGASQDGSKVFFHTNESLLSADTDGVSDLYERRVVGGGGGGGSGGCGIGPELAALAPALGWLYRRRRRS